jgi:formylglycine-generating enzyme required for sulfatase activity
MAMDDIDKHRTPEQEVIRTRQPTLRPTTPSMRELSPGVAKYFRAAMERLNYLQYGDPAEYLLRMKSVEVPNSALDSIWVPPRFKQRDEKGDDISLDTLLGDPSRCLLVLADPGCGKSTLARFLTCFFINRYCRNEKDSFGLLVPLSTLRTSGMTYQEAVVYCAAKYVGLDEDLQVLKDLEVNIGEACIIFDGLDELPISRRTMTEKEPVPLRREAVILISTLRHLQPSQAEGNMPLKSIVTSRSKDYFEDRESNLGTVPHYFISRFSPGQMNTAVRKWHDAAKARAIEHLKDDAKILESLDERQRGIQSALRDHFDLATVCLTPLMLSVLQAVYSAPQDLPSSVSQLCWRAVSWFLVEKHIVTSQDEFVADNAPWLLRTIIEIGWYVHTRMVSGQGTSFNDTDLRRIAKSACPHESLSKADYQTQEDAITSVVSFIRRGHGILVNVSPDEFQFVHNVFREVMAGRALGNLPVPERRDYALNELWHGPIRYWAGLRAGEADGLHEISAFVGELSSDVKTGDALAVLARAEMLVEVYSIVPRNQFTQDLKDRMSEVCDELCLLLKREDLRLAHRIRVGDLLAILGDPKLETGVLDRVHWIDAGNYRIGRDQGHRTRIAKYQTCPASPPIVGDLGRFGIGSYLVTNMEFRRFIDAEGYNNSKYWPGETGWKWASGDTNTVQSLIKMARAVASMHLSSELAAQRLVPDEIPERCVQMIERRLPLYWLDPAYNRPNQPVVGINWWEAVAYCLWLDEVLRDKGALDGDGHIRLPIEAEWETGARLCGNGNIYPWINGEPADCAHVRVAFDRSNDPPVFRSCAVGLFQSVSTSLPIFDLVGNVWEWTASKAGLYAKHSFEQMLDSEGLEDRISRGSSWLSSEEESTQITFRSFDPPYNAYEDLGFRIAIGYGGSNGE